MQRNEVLVFFLPLWDQYIGVVRENLVDYRDEGRSSYTYVQDSQLLSRKNLRLLCGRGLQVA